MQRLDRVRFVVFLKRSHVVDTNLRLCHDYSVFLKANSVELTASGKEAPCRLLATDYSIHSQLPSTLGGLSHSKPEDASGRVDKGLDKHRLNLTVKPNTNFMIYNDESLSEILKAVLAETPSLQG
jgi:hypothetical protein